MIQCDFCKMWYHGKCIRVKINEINEDEDFSCKKCKEWAKHRTSLLLPAIEDPRKGENIGILFPEELESNSSEWQGWNHEIFPQERFKLKLMDILVMSNIWSLQA